MGSAGGMLPPTVSSASSTSAQFSSTAGQSRIGYTRQNSLRGSSSLQDFSAYRTGSLPNGVPRSASLAEGFGSPILSQPPCRGDSPASLTTIKSNLLRRSSGGSVIPLFYNNSFWTRGKFFLLSLVTLVLALLLLGVLWGRYSDGDSHLEYAVVIDCGSTGTRVHVYGWTHDGIGSLPVILKPTRDKHAEVHRNEGAAPILGKVKRQGDSRLYNRMETEPGLDKLLHNESGVATAIEPLIQWATKQIPRAVQRRAKLFFLATAGLRRLPASDSRWLLDEAWSSLTRSPFLCRREWVRIISGQEEAYYGWIALNYNYNRLGFTSNEHTHTLGALDLGGSSLEVTFEPREEIPRAASLVNVSVGSAEHHLYAHSHAGFGLNDAFEKSVALLIESSAVYGKEVGKVQISHPCLHSGYKQPFKCSPHCLLPPMANSHEPHGARRSTLADRDLGPKVELIGRPDWGQCQSLVQSVINVSETTEGKRCKNSKCALGKYQPQPEGQFFALAGFFVVFKFFGLTATNSLEDLLYKGQYFCNLGWEEARQSVISQPSIDRYCFRAPYVVALLRQGLHLRDGQVAVGSGDFAWTLGAALNEAGALLPGRLTGGQGGNYFGLKQSGFLLGEHFYTFLFVFVFLAILPLIVLGRWICSRVQHRPYIPLFVPPSAGSGLFLWFPPSFRSQMRFGTISGAAGGQSGEVRLKQPQSPAPSVPKSFHYQMFESGDMHAGGDGPVLECDVLQDPSSSGVMTSGGRAHLQLATLKMQQKGGSQLQSRRSQSREDLSLYVTPDMTKMKLTRELSPVRVFTPPRHNFSV